jgi:hypothetical protein
MPCLFLCKWDEFSIGGAGFPAGTATNYQTYAAILTQVPIFWPKTYCQRLLENSLLTTIVILSEARISHFRNVEILPFAQDDRKTNFARGSSGSFLWQVHPPTFPGA